MMTLSVTSTAGNNTATVFSTLDSVHVRIAHAIGQTLVQYNFDALTSFDHLVIQCRRLELDLARAGFNNDTRRFISRCLHAAIQALPSLHPSLVSWDLGPYTWHPEKGVE